MRTRQVLVVENDPSRLAWLKRQVRPAVLRVVTNYADALAALGRYQFDVVMFDHDLDDRGRNGQDIAFWMSRMPRSRRPKVIVHSTNLRGSYAMLVTLRCAGFQVESRPFQSQE